MNSHDNKFRQALENLLIEFLSVFKSNNDKLPTNTIISGVNITGGSISSLVNFLLNGTNVEVTEDDSTYSNNKPLPIKIIDRTSTDFLSSFQICDTDNSSNPKYYGFCRVDGRWYIMKQDTSNATFRYASGQSNYSTAWSSRVGLTYDYIYTLTW